MTHCVPLNYNLKQTLIEFLLIKYSVTALEEKVASTHLTKHYEEKNVLVMEESRDRRNPTNKEH